MSCQQGGKNHPTDGVNVQKCPVAVSFWLLIENERVRETDRSEKLIQVLLLTECLKRIIDDCIYFFGAIRADAFRKSEDI